MTRKELTEIIEELANHSDIFSPIIADNLIAAAAMLQRDGERIAALEAERDRLRNRIVNLEDAVHRGIAANVDLQNERDLLQAARYSYASLFSPNADGEPDVDSIHQNIRGLIAERDQLRAELAEWKATTPALKPDCRTCGYFEWRVYECWFESSNPNRLCVDGSEHLHADPVRLYETGEA